MTKGFFVICCSILMSSQAISFSKMGGMDQTIFLDRLISTTVSADGNVFVVGSKNSKMGSYRVTIHFELNIRGGKECLRSLNRAGRRIVMSGSYNYSFGFYSYTRISDCRVIGSSKM